MSELYTKEILRWTMKIPNQKRLDNPTKSMTRRSRICGSSMVMDIMQADDGSIADFGWEVTACAYGQAAAAIIGQHLIGMNKDSIAQLKGYMNDMLRDGENVDWSTVMDGKFTHMQDLKPATGQIGRLGAVFLSVDILNQFYR